MHPRQRRETDSPVRPSFAYRMFPRPAERFRAWCELRNETTLGSKLRRGVRIVKSSVPESSTRSARRGTDHGGMASAQVVALTLNQANAHDRKKQCVDQRHRQYQREDEISRFVQRLRRLLIRDDQTYQRRRSALR